MFKNVIATSTSRRKTMVNIYLNHGFNDLERRDRIFAGDILLYSRSPATAALADHAIALMREAFDPYVPEKAQHSLAVEEFVRRVGPLKSRFTNDLRTKELV